MVIKLLLYTVIQQPLVGAPPPPFPLQSPSLVKLILVFEISFMKFSNCKKFRQSKAGYIKFCTDTSTSGGAWVHAVHLASVVPLASPTSVAAEGFYFFFLGGGLIFSLVGYCSSQLSANMIGKRWKKLM